MNSESTVSGHRVSSVSNGESESKHSLRPRVVIVGAGFGGLQCAKELRYTHCDVVLIERNNHHVFQPLLYQVATAALSPADIAAPVRSIFRSQDNCRVVMDEVTSIDCAARRVHCNEEGEIPYDYLVLAPGTRHAYFGHDEWAAFAPGLKSLADALELRRRMLKSYEYAEQLDGNPESKAYTTFIVVGAGPTGVELAGALAEIGRHTMLRDFHRIKAADIRVILVEAGDRVLPSFHPSLSAKAQRSLEELGVDVRVKTRVEEVRNDSVLMNGERVATRNVLWAAGNQAPAFLREAGLPCDAIGRVHVQRDCSVADYPDVFVIGDAAHHLDDAGKLLPGVAQPAMQQGRFVAAVIRAGGTRTDRPRFHYNDKGSMATIGRARAVAELTGGIRLWGFLAWAGWALVHVVSLIKFRNRFSVMMEWLWYYITYQPGARLIIEESRRSQEELREERK